MIRFILLVILFFLSSLSYFGQSNSFFKNGENWAGMSMLTQYSYGFYVHQLGDTIINNDTLVRLIKPNGLSSFNIEYLLAKNDTGVLYIYQTNSDYSAIYATYMIDYSREDSISYRMNTSYLACKIIDIDTIYLGSIPKKIYRINDACGESTKDFAFEGIFNLYNEPQFDGCFEYENYLTCFSVGGVTYQYSYMDTIFIIDTISKPCVLYNLFIEDSDMLSCKVYPNPACDIINIETAYGTDHIEGAILSTDGREIKKFKLTSDNIQIDINQLPKGLYYLYFSMSHAWMKFIKI